MSREHGPSPEQMGTSESENKKGINNPEAPKKYMGIVDREGRRVEAISETTIGDLRVEYGVADGGLFAKMYSSGGDAYFNITDRAALEKALNDKFYGNFVEDAKMSANDLINELYRNAPSSEKK